MKLVLAGLLAVAVVLGSASCGDPSPGSPHAPEVSPEPVAMPSPGPPDETPYPQHVQFATGEVVDTSGRAGVVFVDPRTGSADAWLLPGVPANYSLSLGASDGHVLFYRCEHPNGVPAVDGCDASDAWYLSDTRTGERTRFDLPRGDASPIVVGPNGDRVLGVAASGASLLSTTDPDRSVRVDVPDGYHLVPSTALSNRDGTRILVSALHTGTPRCGYGSGSNPPYVCGGAPMDWKTLLIEGGVGATTILNDERTSFAWSPGGASFVTTRSIDGAEELAEIAVYRGDGTLVWSESRYALWDPSWSPDGSSIAVQVLSRPEMVAEAMRLDVFDAATGATRFRIVGAIACEGRLWTADSARLILSGAYGLPEGVVADPRDGSLRGSGSSLTPSSTDPAVAYVRTASAETGVVSMNVDTGERRLIASFLSPVAAIESEGQPVIGRLAFVSMQPFGRGGCAEAIDPASPPIAHFEYPPFAN